MEHYWRKRVYNEPSQWQRNRVDRLEYILPARRSRRVLCVNSYISMARNRIQYTGYHNTSPTYTQNALSEQVHLTGKVTI